MTLALLIPGVGMGGGTTTVATPPDMPGMEFATTDDRLHYRVYGDRMHYATSDERLHYKAREPS